MHYLVRIAGMMVGVVFVSAVLAVAVNQWPMLQSVLADIGSMGVFVGLATSGFVGAVLTREYWLPA